MSHMENDACECLHNGVKTRGTVLENSKVYVDR